MDLRIDGVHSLLFGLLSVCVFLVSRLHLCLHFLPPGLLWVKEFCQSALTFLVHQLFLNIWFLRCRLVHARAAIRNKDAVLGTGQVTGYYKDLLGFKMAVLNLTYVIPHFCLVLVLRLGRRYRGCARDKSIKSQRDPSVSFCQKCSCSTKRRASL